MRCCVNCFTDTHLQDTVIRLGRIGNCDFCDSKAVSVYDISEANEISEKIKSLLQIYTASDSEGAKSLFKALKEDWDIFSGDENQIQLLIMALCGEEKDSYKDLFDQNVEIAVMSDEAYLIDYGVVKGHSWKEFCDCIKYKNRFHSNMFNPDAFSTFLSSSVKYYKTASEFYRARIGKGNNWYFESELGCPPQGKRTAGRINPEEIPVLYLSTDKETVLNEVRAYKYDYVSVGLFVGKRDLRIINLSGISQLSPFLYRGELEQFAINRTVLKEIAEEIAKPLRRSDTPFEYLPTQYISEFIKSQGYDGVEYKSTIGDGYNVALYDEDVVECVDVKRKEVRLFRGEGG